VRTSFVSCAVAVAVATPVVLAQVNRSIDGTGNNLANPDWGSAGALLLREASGANYADGVDGMMPFANPRATSNGLGVQVAGGGNALRLSSMFWQWGQFIDHDFALSPESHTDSAPIPVPAGDPFFDPMNSGTQTIHMNRSEFEGGVSGPREQFSVITHFLDGSMVYGSDDARATALRSGVGGRLLTGPGGMLPKNTGGLPNAGGPDPELFVAGDIRANEQTGLTAMHTIFVREHNFWARRIALLHPNWSDEQIYQRARKIVGAEIQAITYNEWLPLLLGQSAIPEYSGYDSNTNATLSNVFATAAFRFGHTMLNEELLRYGEGGAAYGGGDLSLAQAFFNVSHIEEAGGLEAILRGLAWQEANEIDTQVVGAVRNMLFGPPGAGGLDLLSLNLNRGMDHGLQDYNTVRQDYGLAPVSDFPEICSEPAMLAGLQSMYSSVDEIHPWIGMMAEDHLPGAAVGETLAAVLSDQFGRMRDGDRYFYLNDPELGPGLTALIESTTLSEIIRRNSSIRRLQDDVFIFEDVCYADCDRNGRLNLIDFICFQFSFLSGDSYADCDGSGQMDLFDVLCFREAFLQGCP